jgi:phenylacetate-CoA ligase
MIEDLRRRFPLIDAAGARLLRELEEHPHAPKWTHPSVNGLSAGALAHVAEFERECQQAPAWDAASLPGWLPAFLARCYAQVPLYRRRGRQPESFFAVPTTGRSDLAREPWSFVPDDVPVRDLTVYNTTGVTGHPLSLLTNADTLALYFPLMRAALAVHGVTLDGGPGRTSVVVVAAQQRTYTYAAVSAVLGQAGVVKVNLAASEWRDLADRAAYLDALAPEVFTGDPLALAELAQLPLTQRPRALLSTAMALNAGVREELAARFGCPVVDVYSLNESGPVAVLRPRMAATGNEFLLLQPRLFVEILDEAGNACPSGRRGEVTLTGGFNPFLPLLRYRTNDYARLEWAEGRPVLVDLEGRAPVTFRATDGRVINNIDVSLALRDLPLPQFTLHQAADGALTFCVRDSSVAEAQLRAILLGLFGAEARLAIEPLTATDKIIQYTRDE